MHKLNIIILSLLVVACATRQTPAPIINVTSPISKKSVAIVKKPSVVQQTTEVASEPTISKIDNNDSSIVIDNSVVTTKNVASSSEWIMPTNGKIIQPYTKSNKGINIAGKEGQDIVAINSGKVVYSGNGLKGYGNLIIIKHSSTYLSAYAHNKINVVKEGDNVTRGQKIAEMGSTDSKSTMLHLEVRKNGKPINPDTLIKG